MTASLGERIRKLRHRSFVGRDAEIALFRELLPGPGVLFLHGPGGVGKTALLDVLAELAPDRVLFLDDYEQLAKIDDWVRDEYLPSLPDDAFVVIAGRHPPGPRWRADPAWRELLHVVPLGTLPPADAREYLEIQQVPPEQHDRLLAISRGHPLTLSMLVDAVRRGADPHSLADVPDVVGALLAQILDEAPSPRHRHALDLCAHAPVTTEDLVGEDLFAWLRTLPIIVEGPHGLFPHDVVRDALDADLRWRDPARWADLHRRLHAGLVTRIHAAPGEQERLRILAGSIVVAGPRLGLLTYPAPPVDAVVDRLRDADRAAIVAITAAWQGEEQAALVAYWLDAQPAAFRIFRSASGDPDGYAACLDLSEPVTAADPEARAMLRYADQHGAPRPGERVRAWRFFLDRRHGQRPSPSMTLATACQMLDILTHDDTAWTFLAAYADAEMWGPTMAFLDFWRATDAGDTTFPVYAHDWRRTGVAEWLELVAARGAGVPTRPAEEPSGDPVLSQPEFAEAVRSALRDLHDPRKLRESPLVRSRAVGPAALKDLLVEAAGTLPPALRAVADRTFLRPATTQERVAEELHLSFSTYRRHRDRAVAQIAAWLWDREIGHRTTSG